MLEEKKILLYICMLSFYKKSKAGEELVNSQDSERDENLQSHMNFVGVSEEFCENFDISTNMKSRASPVG